MGIDPRSEPAADNKAEIGVAHRTSTAVCNSYGTELQIGLCNPLVPAQGIAAAVRAMRVRLKKPCAAAVTKEQSSQFAPTAMISLSRSIESTILSP